MKEKYLADRKSIDENIDPEKIKKKITEDYEAEADRLFNEGKIHF